MGRVASFRLSQFTESAPSDRELIARTLGGDGAAFAVLVDRFQRKIFRVAFAIVRDDMEADTITQDTFIQAFTHLGKFEGRSEFETWLTRIAINRSRDFLRRRRFVSLFAPLEGNLHFFLISLTVAWTLAAFGEEFVYRGYLLRRIAQVLGDEPRAWRAALVTTSILFGVGHAYQGLSGVISAGLGGFVFGLLYLATGRNLWVCVIAHGTTDTVGFLLLYLGRYPGV